MKKIILASTSVYRQQLLSQLQLDFVAVASSIDETLVQNQNLSPAEISQQLAFQKAKAVFTKRPTDLIIGSDQIVSLGERIFHQPHTLDQAMAQLKELSGKSHQLITSVCLLSDKGKKEFSCMATLKMHSLSQQQIERYIEKDRPLSCAGSYKLESLGISLFEKIETSDYTTIIGLPLMQLSSLLRSFGYPIP